MWARLCVALSISTCAWAQQTRTKVQQGGSSFEWGWHQGPQGDATVGHYYVKLPESEQHVNYAADDSGYHGALAANTSVHQYTHSASFALGERALQLNKDQAPSSNFQAHPGGNVTSPSHQQTDQVPNNPPLEIYLLQQQYNSPIDQRELFQVQPTAIPENLVQYSNTPYYYLTNNAVTTPLYSVQQQHPPQNSNYESNDNNFHTQPLNKGDISDQQHEILTTSVVRVFKDQNCSHDGTSDSVAKETVNDAQNPNKLSSGLTNYEVRNINGRFGEKHTTPRALTYKGAVHFRVEAPRDNSRSERYYYTTISPNIPTPTNNNEYYQDEGIDKLVASTQDLISNEDLLRINHAAEQQVQINTDDLIKPRPRFSLRGEQTRYTSNYNYPSSKFTVKAKIGRIVNNDDAENRERKEPTLQNNSNDYKFVTPIVVAEPSSDYKEQILNNLVSTMVPYIADGYELLSVKNTLEEKDEENQENKYNAVDATPRPISQKYLAPITVALRLLNANDTETLNSVEDHEGSDSELIPETVERPRNAKTVVEIQESIPVSITHINDVEVHEYLEMGRSNNNGPFDFAKSLINRYVESLEPSKKIQKNMNDIFYKNGNVKKYEGTHNVGRNHNEKQNDDEDDNNNSEENFDSSENVQIQLVPNQDSNQRKSELVDYYNDYDSKKIIQPIVIEKQVPVTKFVDRFIEKQVPYPQPVEVVKTVSVDRPVPFPVPYEKVVEKPVEVTRYVDKPYPVEFHHPYPVGVPYPVEHKVFVDRPVHVPYPIEKVVEKQVIQTVPVPTPVAVPVEVPVPVEQKVLYPVPIHTPVAVPFEVERPVPVDRIVHKEVPVPYPVEKRVPYPVPYETRVPVPYAVEKKVPVTVEKIVEKPVTVTKYVEKPVHIQVPVPQPVPVPVHVREPYPVDRIVEKKVPYPVPVDRIVEKKVPVKVPYPVQTFVEKIVEKPVVVTKYVDKPYPVEKRVPYPVEKIVERKIPYPVQIPYEVKVPYPVDRIVEKPVHIPIRVPYPVEKIIEKPYAVYTYGYGRNIQQQPQQSQNVPQYIKYGYDQQKQQNQNQAQKNVLHSLQNQAQIQNLRDRLQQSVQSTQWGNQYASSYQYVNTSKQANDLRKSLTDYINYMTNSQSNNYYGPPPMQDYDDWWQKNKDYVVEMKVRRTDRTPKVTKLRIEYGGFKPPLIPSTEVDLDGLPVNKNEDQT
ncbi:hypothetical protein evm_001480 [Chilo suppressalis]|nr:hypothetical protein evm_001480 [Chilo suppressalis]